MTAEEVVCMEEASCHREDTLGHYARIVQEKKMWRVEVDALIYFIEEFRDDAYRNQPENARCKQELAKLKKLSTYMHMRNAGPKGGLAEAEKYLSRTKQTFNDRVVTLAKCGIIVSSLDRVQHIVAVCNKYSVL